MQSMQDRQVTLSENALFQEIGGDGVILDLTSASYFGLDRVGVRFWTLLQADPSLLRAFDVLLAEYEVAPELLKSDLDALVAQLVDAGLVTVK
jgi:hypothetical protein